MSCSAAFSKSAVDYLLEIAPCPPSPVSNTMFRQFAKSQKLSDCEVDFIVRKCGREERTVSVSRTSTVSTASTTSLVSSIATSTAILVSPPTPSLPLLHRTLALVLTGSIVMISITLLLIIIIYWKNRRRGLHRKYIPSRMGKGEDTLFVTPLSYKHDKSQKYDTCIGEMNDDDSFVTVQSYKKRISQNIDMTAMDDDASFVTVSSNKERKSQKLDMIETDEETSFLPIQSHEELKSQT